MKIRISAAIFAALLAGAAAAEPPVPGELSRHLTELMQADKLIVATVRNALTAEQYRDKLTAAQRDCLSSVDLGFARDLYAQLLEDTLTPDELQAALRYYQTPAGHMNMMMALRKHRAELGNYPGMAEAEAAGEPTAEDMRAIMAFAQTDIGRKMSQMHTTPAGQKLVNSLATGMLKQCRPQS